MKEQGMWGHFDRLIEDIQLYMSCPAFKMYTSVQQENTNMFLKSIIKSPKVFFPASGDVIQSTGDVNDEVKKLVRLPYPSTVILTDNRLYDKVVVVAHDMDILCAEAKVTNPSMLNKEWGIAFSVAVNQNNLWTMLPVLCALYPRDAGICGVEVKIIKDGTIDKLRQTNNHDTRLSTEELTEALQNLAGTLGTLTLLNTCVMLNTHNTTQETVKAPKFLNQKRVKKGNRPLLDYKILVVDGERWHSNDAARNMVHGDGSGKRSHLRRGHIRHLASGKSTYVRATYVHGSSKGFVEKDYFIGDKNALRQQSTAIQERI